ncbi:MAG: DUF1697 domain-containing protein [Paraglaciecola sp.]|nr:DUF1697 domain-containing protein [Paraglaciecola sp.]NCT46856.1 DUF1697 domain-containing protein [Paraglaciecola sp.]
MHTRVALLRGINVGGKHLIKMADLSALMQQHDCQQVRTYIQSGNLVFHHTNAQQTELAAQLSALISQRFGFAVPVYLLTGQCFLEIVASNPFAQASLDGKSVHVYFLEHAARAANHTKLMQLKHPSEQYHLTDKAFYLFAPQGVGRSKLAAKVDKCLGVNTTARNANTLCKLRDMLS